ncbi:hypothetical protein POM88_039078 [Heracleum sosnowskyi]|uniref:Uncharacterized protein n=1 Tax=Heracleum sosnowskyi TaxID=360622 RepID=A0AAD8H997_9APIA|nr:hypothetical protein POM88_039078 [Heracleum sosnowskyi]
MFYFVNLPPIQSLDSLHGLVAENGGTSSMNLNNTVTHCIAAESKGATSTPTTGSTYMVIPHNHKAPCWDNYDLVKLFDGTEKARHRLCGKLFGSKGNSTLKRHHSKLRSYGSLSKNLERRHNGPGKKDARKKCNFFLWVDPPYIDRAREVVETLKAKLRAKDEELQRATI